MIEIELDDIDIDDINFGNDLTLKITSKLGKSQFGSFYLQLDQ